MAINGMDCMCEAQHEGQCSCGCDWTTTKEARLQARNAELLAALTDATERMDRAHAILSQHGNWQMLETDDLNAAIQGGGE